MMNGKRLAAAAVAAALTVSLAMVPASAASFTDLKGHWSQTDVEYLAGEGVIQGYNDGTFKPDAMMSAVEALLFCARVTGLEESVQKEIAQDWADTLKEILPTSMQSWASQELAVCLETGIISVEELKSMADSDALLKSMERQEVARCLVRAIQMAPMAQQLDEVRLDYADQSQIDQNLRCYVYVLDTYGIVKGNDKNQFLPTGGVTRAEMATLLRRSLDFMESRGVVVELPDYTDYDWTGGVITSVTEGKEGATILTLEDDLLGQQSVTIPFKATIYDNNMKTDADALKSGSYVRINFADDGQAQSVRIGGKLTTVSGTVTAFDGENLTIKSGTQTQTLKMDRFTTVQVGNRLGSIAMLDPESGYTTAVCRVDELGHPAGVQLAGGSRQESGILSQVVTDTSGKVTTLYLSTFDGIKTPYTLSSSAAVTVNGVSGTLKTSYTGDFVTIKVSNDNDQLLTVNVDTVSDYIQGSIQGMSYSKTPNTVTILDFATGKSATYNLSENAQITYEGKKVAFRDLSRNQFVTLRLSGNEVDLMDAWPGSSTVSGTVTAISYGVTTTIDVTLADGTVRTYDIDLSNPPEIYRDKKASSIDKLRTGDQVELTIRYNQVSAIEATAQSANATGTITAITLDSSGTTITVEMTGGGTKTYVVTDSVSVTQNGKAIAVSSLKPGYQIAMVVDGDQVQSIEVERTSGSNTQFVATVLYVNTSDKTILLQRTDAQGTTGLITVDVSDAEALSASGSELYLKDLAAGDRVQIFGAYSGLDFEATIVIRI